MKPGSLTRRHFEKMQNPYVDLDNGTSIYYRDVRQPAESAFAQADAYGPKGYDSNIDLHNEYKVVPDVYPEGFTWRHRLNTEYNQWRSNTWWTPEMMPAEHRGRFLCNFYLNMVDIGTRRIKFGPFDSRHWSYVSLYVGTGKGMAGFGDGIGPSMREAKTEAVRNAFENVIAVDLEDEGPRYPVNINYEGKRILLYPSNRICGHALYADILCAFGFNRGGVKYGLTAHRTQGNVTPLIVRGIFEAIRRYRSINEVAHSRGRVPGSLLHNYYPYLEEVRRRKGMMAQHPQGKDRPMLFHPNRVVDNRLPDHLKKGYYDDVYWRDFFAGQDPSRLHDPKLGLRGDEQRSQLTLNPNYKGSTTPGRRTLADVLQRMGKSMKDLYSLEVRNPYIDQPISEHWKETYPYT